MAGRPKRRRDLTPLERQVEHRRDAYRKKIADDFTAEARVSAACDYLRGAMTAAADRAAADRAADRLVPELLHAGDALTAASERARRRPAGANAQAPTRAQRARARWRLPYKGVTPN